MTKMCEGEASARSDQAFQSSSFISIMISFRSVRDFWFCREVKEKQE